MPVAVSPSRTLRPSGAQRSKQMRAQGADVEARLSALCERSARYNPSPRDSPPCPGGRADRHRRRDRRLDRGIVTGRRSERWADRRRHRLGVRSGGRKRRGLNRGRKARNVGAKRTATKRVSVEVSCHESRRRVRTIGPTGSNLAPGGAPIGGKYPSPPHLAPPLPPAKSESGPNLSRKSG